MTTEQINEAMKIIPLLNKCREHIDNATYNMGDIPEDDPQFWTLRDTYSLICRALDNL